MRISNARNPLDTAFCPPSRSRPLLIPIRIRRVHDHLARRKQPLQRLADRAGADVVFGMFDGDLAAQLVGLARRRPLRDSPVAQCHHGVAAQPKLLRQSEVNRK